MKLYGYSGKKLPVLSILAMLSLLTAVGCGKTQYQKQDYTATSVAGQYTQPKIDILIIQDNSDSMATPIQNLKGQLEGFLSNINSNWDFHFTVLPLQSVMSLNSKYIVAQDCSSINSSYCIGYSQISSFNNITGNDSGWIRTINSATGNTDLGFQNIKSNLQQSSMSSSNFLRADAALAIIVVSNGEDVTNVGYKDRGDGVMVIDYNGSTSQNSLNSFVNYISGLKNGSGLSKFYSVVAAQNYSSCYGSSAWQGYRYMSASSQLSSPYYNICSSSALSSVLSNISSQINSMITAYKFNYAVINEKPIVSSIVVKKNGTVVPQGNSNGWSYVGYMVNQPTSYYPMSSNNKTGYFIKLNGTAEYSGSDIITVDYEKE